MDTADNENDGVVEMYIPVCLETQTYFSIPESTQLVEKKHIL